MAENLDDGEFWLSPQFLGDDDEDKTAPVSSIDDPLQHNNVDDAQFHFISFGSFAAIPCSDLSSPVGGSRDIESEEDEHLHRVTELTRGFAHSFLDSDSKTSKILTDGFASGSPQSTLCAFGCRKGSSQGSPNSVSNMCSAKETWDLLHAAAGEVERMRLSLQEDFAAINNNNGTFVPRMNSPPPPLNNNTNPDFRFYTQQQSLPHQQLQIAQTYKILLPLFPLNLDWSHLHASFSLIAYGCNASCCLHRGSYSCSLGFVSSRPHVEVTQGHHLRFSFVASDSSATPPLSSIVISVLD